MRRGACWISGAPLEDWYIAVGALSIVTALSNFIRLTTLLVQFACIHSF